MGTPTPVTSAAGSAPYSRRATDDSCPTTPEANRSSRFTKTHSKRDGLRPGAGATDARPRVRAHARRGVMTCGRVPAPHGPCCSCSARPVPSLQTRVACRARRSRNESPAAGQVGEHETFRGARAPQRACLVGVTPAPRPLGQRDREYTGRGHGSQKAAKRKCH